MGGAGGVRPASRELSAGVCFPALLLAHSSPPVQVDLGKPCIPLKRLSPGAFTAVLPEFQMFCVVRGMVRALLVQGLCLDGARDQDGVAGGWVLERD